MRQLVAGEENLGVLEKLVSDHVAECVVFLVDCKDCGVGDFCVEFFENSKKNNFYYVQAQVVCLRVI